MPELTNVTRAQVEEVAQRCGLSPSDVLLLLQEGWAYIEELGRPIRWEKHYPLLKGEVKPPFIIPNNSQGA